MFSCLCYFLFLRLPMLLMSFVREYLCAASVLVCYTIQQYCWEPIAGHYAHIRIERLAYCCYFWLSSARFLSSAITFSPFFFCSGEVEARLCVIFGVRVCVTECLCMCELWNSYSIRSFPFVPSFLLTSV